MLRRDGDHVSLPESQTRIRCAWMPARLEYLVVASRPFFQRPGHVRCRELRKKRINTLLEKER